MLFHSSSAHWLSVRWLEVHTVGKKKKEVNLVRPVKSPDSELCRSSWSATDTCVSVTLYLGHKAVELLIWRLEQLAGRGVSDGIGCRSSLACPWLGLKGGRRGHCRSHPKCCFDA